MSNVSSTTFRDALARFASGVTVITTVDDQGSPHGFTASAFTSVSLEPYLVAICVGQKVSSRSVIEGRGVFGVSILAREQEGLAKRFGAKGIDRFAEVELRHGSELGVPLLEGALVQLECRVHARHEAGDHVLIVGEVVDVRLRAGAPLVHFQRQFGAFEPDVLGAPLTAATPAASANASGITAIGSTLTAAGRVLPSA